ncbi:M13-type metalloendopeptidase [Fructilactobacillus vespulae]|uniref:M13 family metallopeptidase n=1 Tax=Fructilactobacillus vespulae TaxID=1249630 RepID=UPI0039B6157D
MPKDEFPINQAQIKDDIYAAVNGEWIEHATIPADHSTVGGFMDLVDDIDKTLMHDSDELVAGNIPAKNELAEYVKLFQMTNDFEKREHDGATPLKPIIDKIKNLKDYSDLNNQLSDWMLAGLPVPFDFGIDPDMKHAEKNALFAGSPALFLPDKTYYEKDNPAYQQLMPIFTSMNEKLLTMVGYSEADAKKLVDQAKQFDALVAPFVKSAEESADYSKMYNPQSLTEVASSTTQLDLQKAISDLVNAEPEKIIVTEPNYFKHLNELLTDENFDLIKAWMLVKVVKGYSSLLSEEFRQVGGTYSRALSGKKEATNQKKAAYYLASGTFDQVIGDYYGRKYFGEKAKADVHQMVEKMIKVYQDRLENNDWLSPETKKMAVKKLSTLGINVGYPDQIDPLYTKFKVDQQESLLENITRFNKIATADSFAKWDQPVDKTKWEMSAAMVNAYYHPFMNIIVFPAAILQAPFYSLDQSSSENFGGIGAVIAHEISHAFDNNGSLFDETGSLNNWWTKEDHEQFTKFAQQMIDQFNDIPFAGSKVNGKLTVSENIADAGGLSCAEAAAKQEADADLEAFFINWSRIWRMKATPEYQQLLLSIDVHAPAPLRASEQVKNLDDFYTTFNVTEKDHMYLEPSKRVKIW